MSKIISLQDNARLVNEKAYKSLLHFTPQLFILTEEKNSIEAFGSGVFFEIEDNHYLITAGHCIRQNGANISVGILDKGRFTFLKGTVVLEQGKDNKIDVAVVKLSNESVIICKHNYGFITQTHLLENRTITEETEYLIVGHPISKTSIDYKRKKIKYEPLGYLSKSREDKYYGKLGFNKQQSILLSFNRRRSCFMFEGGMNISPNPKGISGCGLWYIPSYFTEEITFKLAGIMVEYHNELNTVVATKNEVIIPLILALTQ
jgi:hypothetical protein